MPWPSFRTACLLSGGLYGFLADGILLQGAPNAMAQYGVPEATRALPHYADAITWVYVHLAVLGAIFTVVGWWGRDSALHRPFARLVVATHAVYGIFDFRSSEPFGNGLHEGPQSAIPAFACVFVLLLFVGSAFSRAPSP